MAPRLLVVDDNQELLSLLTQIFEEAGYQVLAAARAKQALELARTGTPALALLDVLLPDMMGFALADQLRREAPQLPIIFMSGVFKGGKQAMEAQAKHNALAYFEKPFDAKKLIAAIAKVVPPGKQTPQAAAEAAFEVELDVDIEEEEPIDAMELTGRITVTGGGNLSAEIRGENLTARPVAPGRQALVRPPAPGFPKLAGPTRATDPRSRRGEITDNLPALITAFHTLQETGELGCQRNKVKKVIYFEKGQPVFALSNLVSDRFGQFLVRVGKITAEQFKDCASVAKSSKRRTGDVLIERGLLKETERMYYVAQQVKAIIYSLFGWEEGAYTMTFTNRLSHEPIKLDVHPANLILRGVKKLYKPERLKRLLHPEDRLTPSQQPAFQLNELGLERWEADLLPKVDGTRNVAELEAIARKPEHMLYGSLYALMSMHILESRT